MLDRWFCASVFRGLHGWTFFVGGVVVRDHLCYYVILPPGGFVEQHGLLMYG